MEIRKVDNINFGKQVKTNNLFETLLLKRINSEGVEGYRDVVYSLYPNMRFVGNKGYRYYAKQIQEKVLTKYPQLAEDIAEIDNHIKANPKISQKELSKYVEPYFQKYGENIDIEI
jgi:hypothetical protein